MNRRLVSALLAIFLPVFLVFICAPARAGHWVITYKCSGQGTSVHLTLRYVSYYRIPDAIVASGTPVWTLPWYFSYFPPYSGGEVIRAFPMVTHTWSDSTSIQPFNEFDPSTFYSTDHYDICSFQEVSTEGISGPDYDGNFDIIDTSATVGDPNAGTLWTSSEQGTITPVLTWTLDSSTDTSTPPLSVTVAETSSAVAFNDAWADQPQSPFSAADGFSDPEVGSNVGSVSFQPVLVNQQQSVGTKIVSVDTGGMTVVTFPPVSLSASGGSHYAGTGTQVSLGVTVVDPIHASSTASPGPETNTYAAPQYFSGTACIAHAYANPALFGNNTTAYLRSAIMRINGTVVRRWPEDYTTTSTTPGAGLYVMFDSTHFPDGTPIKIEIECHDSLGRSYTAHLTAPAYNKGLVLANNTVDNFANTSTTDTWQHVTTVADLVNNSVTNSEYYHQADVLAAIPANTVFYIATHGAPAQFGDCFATPTSDTDTYITPGDLIPAIQLKKSPTAQLPPYNFVQLDSCEAGTDDIAKPFLYGVNGEQSPTVAVDRAFLGFLDPVQICSQNGDWTERVWNYLSEGSTLADAVKLSTINGDTVGGVISIPVLPSDIPLGPFSHPISPVIRGDGAMKLHGVYGGVVTNDGLGGVDVPWYKPL